MNFVYEGGVLKAQASDGYRLAVAHENIEASPGVSPAGMIVHNKSIRKLLPVIPKQGSVVIGFSDRFYVGMEDGTRFSFVCIAQRYPDVERILPFEDTVIGTVDSGVMLRSIERAQFVCRGVETKFPYIRVALTGSGDSGEIRLSFGSEDTTEFDERLHAQVAAEAEIKINTAYFREIFAALGGSVAMNCNSEGRPVIFKNPQRPGRTGLVAQIS
jgi:DNA polymerase III sliding clamp (beta) subunit (PCNA family)